MDKFQIILLLSVVSCAILSTVQSVPVSDSSVESENAAKCKKLCGFCGCTGYYCGDECLCECNSATDGEAACVDTMKSNCKKLELPFEVLIQGPNVNRLVRSLLYANPDEETCLQSAEFNQKKRSTISIYKPHEIQQNDEILAAPKLDDEAELVDESPVPVMVAEKENSESYQVKGDETVDENIHSSSSDVESNQQNDNVDRVNTKRHIVDINQDISEFSDDFDDSFLYKRDAEPAAPADEPPTVPADETVGAAAPIDKPAPGLLPKFRKALDSIPTSDEIKSAWEEVRKDMNAKINSAIAAAQKKAAELRSKISPPKPVNPPKPAAPSIFNPFLKAENDEDNVGMALRPAVSLLPIVPWSPAAIAETEFAKNIAAARAANQISKNAFIKNWNNNLLNPWLLGLPLDPVIGAPADETVEPAEPAEPTEEKKE